MALQSIPKKQYQSIPGTFNNISQGFNYPNQGVYKPVAPAITQPAAAPVGAPSTGGNGIDEAALAEMKRQADFQAAKDQAGNLRSNGQSTFNDLLTAINAFRDRNKQSYADAGQQITNQSSDMLGTNAATAQDLVGKATGRARGLGLGLSSRINLGSDLLRNLEGTQGNVIAKTGEQNAANLGLYNTRQDNAQNQENTANTYLKGINDSATTLQNTGIDNANFDFANTLNGIVNYQRQLAALQAPTVASATPYTPSFSGVTNTLNSVLSGIGGGAGVDATAGATNAYSNPADTIKRLMQLYGQG